MPDSGQRRQQESAKSPTTNSFHWNGTGTGRKDTSDTGHALKAAISGPRYTTQEGAAGGR